ncbi:AbrB family looped-hinge helix DNA binding protein [Methanohalophilus levihalophilus]|uniref:AbrB/MazE/SpoVT family DNA-binding domain-containing protein n=1 Tax=Methanohalophilus levihalophilus TaxID=1431282 RepID=UPI001FDA101E|nr:AbrB/MazE/SpoVT family DNA-binding domain-containing protein [Methanohalophilus levihalophilus]MBP2029280.1 AbrB family looped-hinge helix DNA binding protein [Methanohalophilus levihalophilus]
MKEKGMKMESEKVSGILGLKDVTVSSKGQIVIPKELRKGTFPEGSQAAVIAYADHIEIRPLTYVLEKLECALISEPSFAEEWDTPEEDKAWEDLLDHALEYEQNKK